MKRLFLRLIPFLLLIFTVTMLLIQSRPYDDSQLRKLLMPDDCDAPCFIGIRPGVTTAEAALDILKTHPWVASYEILHEPPSSPPYVVYWEWNGQQPDFLRGDSRPQMILTYDRIQLVESILVDTTIPVGYAYLMLGQTDTTYSGRSVTMRNGIVINALFNDPSVLVWATIPCPVSYSKFWNAPMGLELSKSLNSLRNFDGMRQYC
jgi:hypothetical protein